MFNLNAIKQVYQAAIYGASHQEVRELVILKKFNSKTACNQLAKKKTADILEEIEAIEKVKNSEIHSIELTNKQVRLVRIAMRENLKNTRRVPSLAREQAIISLASNFEAYISDLLREIFDKNVDSLKSGKSTLKDEELIESIKTGSVLITLKEAKIRDLMYGSVKSWIDYFQKGFGFQITLNNDLNELYLVRNCLVHNNGITSKELVNEIKTGRYKLGNKINVTERDYKRYEAAIIQVSETLWSENNKKFNKI